MKKTMIPLLAAFVLGWNAEAQEIVNPAEAAFLENGFVRIGEFQSNSRNNVGAASFIFPKEDKLVTGLHSSVGTDQFPGGLKAVNSLYNALNYNLVSYGWRGRGRGFHSIEIGAKVNYGASVPKEIFQILKTGTSQSPYDLSSLRAFGNVYGEIAYAYSFPFGEHFSLGGRVKLLVGLNSLDIIARKFDVTTTMDQYKLDFDADIDMTNFFRKAWVDGEGHIDYTSYVGKGKFGMPTGAGLAMDLGFVWKPFRGFSLSASVNDLGGILWYYGNGGYSSGSYAFDGLRGLSMDELNEKGLMERVNGLKDEVLGAIMPKVREKSLKLKYIPLSASLKTSYAMPFWERLSAEASCLYTGYRFCLPYWEARGGLALDFPGVAHLGVNAGSGACGFVYSVNGSVNIQSFKLYASFENGIGGVIPYEGIPLQANNNCLLIGLAYLLK